MVALPQDKDLKLTYHAIQECKNKRHAWLAIYLNKSSPEQTTSCITILLSL